MAVRIRLKRAGRRHLPFYHIAIFDVRQRRDGAAIERIGSYDPTNKTQDKQVLVDVERAGYWLSQGASPSDTVMSILKKAGCTLPEAAKVAEKRTRKPSKKAAGVKVRTKRRTSNSKTRAAKKNKTE